MNKNLASFTLQNKQYGKKEPFKVIKAYVTIFMLVCVQNEQESDIAIYKIVFVYRHSSRGSYCDFNADRFVLMSCHLGICWPSVIMFGGFRKFRHRTNNVCALRNQRAVIKGPNFLLWSIYCTMRAALWLPQWNDRICWKTDGEGFIQIICSALQNITH